MEVSGLIAVALAALYVGLWCGILAEMTWGCGARLRYYQGELRESREQLAAAIKERDELREKVAKDDRFMDEMLDDLVKYGDQWERDGELISAIVAALDKHSAETGGEGEGCG